MTLTHLGNQQYLGTPATNVQFQLNSVYDYYVFIDTDDSNKIKARDNRTGAIVSTHATNADVVINYCLAQLTNGGIVFIGPGSFNIYLTITHATNPNLHIISAGRGITKLVRQITTNTNIVSFVTNNCSLRHITIDGNYPTNQSLTGAEVVFAGLNYLCFDVEVKNSYGTCDLMSTGSGVIDSCILKGAWDNYTPTTFHSERGVMVYPNAAIPHMYNVIRNCFVTYHYEAGIRGAGETCIVDGNYLANNNLYGGGNISYIDDTAKGTMIVTNNYITKLSEGVNTWNNDSGIEASNGTSWLVSNNIVNGVSGYGIIFQGLTDEPNKTAIISNNIVHNAGYTGIQVGIANNIPMSNFTIVGNLVYDDKVTPTCLYGIFVRQVISDYYVIKNNICFGSTSSQIADLGIGVNKFVGDNVTSDAWNYSGGPTTLGKTTGQRGPGWNFGSGITSQGTGLLSNVTSGLGASSSNIQFATSNGGPYALYVTGTANAKGRAGWWFGGGLAACARVLNPTFTVRFRLNQAQTGSQGIFYLGFINIAAQPVNGTSMLDTMLDTKIGVLFGFRSSDTVFKIMSNNAQSTATYTTAGTPNSSATDTNLHTISISLVNIIPSINWSYDGIPMTPITDTNLIPPSTTALVPIIMLEAQTATALSLVEIWSKISMDPV